MSDIYDDIKELSDFSKKKEEELLEKIREHFNEFRRIINTHIKDEKGIPVGLGFSLGQTHIRKGQTRTKEGFINWGNEIIKKIMFKCEEMIKRNDKRNDEEIIKKFETTGEIKNISAYQGLAAFILRNKEKLKGN